MSNRPELSIIIPTKDRHPILLKSLESVLSATNGLHCEIFIIDNSTSSDIELPDKLKSANLSVLKNPGNKNSVFSSRNYGASISSSDLLLLIDDDIIITKESIDFVISFHKELENAALNVSWEYPKELVEKMKRTIFGRYTIKSGFTTMRELYGINRWQNAVTFESHEVASYFLSFKKEHFIKIGGYDERHLYEGTDVDIINRLSAHGIKMYINAALTIFHNEEDRISINNWMQRRKRFGEICSNANALGDKHELNYGPFHKFIFYFTYKIRKSFIFFIEKSPQNIAFMDFFYFKLLDLLTGAHTYYGYHKSRS